MNFISLSDDVTENMKWEDIIPDNRIKDIAIVLDDKTKWQMVEDYCRTLTERQQTIFKEHLKGVTFRKIGRELKLSGQRIQQIWMKIIDRMTRYFENRR